MLPVAATPAPSEPLDAFLERVSYATPTSLGHLHRTFHLTHHRRSFTPAITISRTTQLTLSTWMQVSASAVEQHTLLGAYPALAPPTTHPTARSIITAAHSRWFFLSYSRFCPTCLATGQPWQLSWRLPWTIACPLHDTRLADTCPRCGNNPREQHRGSAPRREPEEPVDPAVCQRPHTPHTTGRSTPRCREPLGNTTTDVATDETLQAQESVLTAIRVGTTLLDEYLTNKQALSAAIDITRLTLRGTHHERRLFPLRDLTDSTTGTLTTAAVLTSSSPLDAADVIRAARRSPRELTHNDVLAAVSDRHGPLKPVLDVLLSQSGRISTRVHRRQTYLPVTDATVEQVPLLLWPCATPDLLRNDRRSLHYRFLLSLTVAKAITGTWEDAAEGLALPRDKGRAWSKHLINTTPAPHRSLIPETTHQVLAKLATAPVQARGLLPTLRFLHELPQTFCKHKVTGAWCLCE